MPSDPQSGSSARSGVWPAWRRLVVGFTVIVGVAAVNYAWLSLLDVDYIGWYLGSGFLVALLFGVVSVAIDLDSQPRLIAADPLLYLGAVAELLGTLSGALSDLYARPRSDQALADVGLGHVALRFRIRVLDLVLSLAFGLAVVAATLAWVLLIVPLQYWVTLVCGAPARESLASSGTLWVVSTPHSTEMLFAPKDPTEFERAELQQAHERGEMTEVGFAKRPVSFTAAIGAAVLFGVSLLT